MSRKGYKWTEEHRARMSASQTGKRHSAETRAKLRALWIGKPSGRRMSEANKTALSLANKGRTFSADHRAKLSAARIGKSHSPCSDATKARISAALTGKKRSTEFCAKMSVALKGRKLSVSHRIAMGDAQRGKARASFSQSWRDNISAAGRGRVDSAETQRRRSAAMSRAWEEGRHRVHKSYRYTSLAQALHAHLKADGLALEPEVRFGRYTVDLYDREHHIAYEADGKYWHDKNEAERPGYHANRDAYLLERFALKVIHFNDIEIERITRARRVA